MPTSSSRRANAHRHLVLLLLLMAMSSLVLPRPAEAQSPQIKTSRNHRMQYDSMRGMVMVFTSRAITIRDRKNINLIRTFSYDPKLLPKMQKRHYKWGDRVRVKYLRGTDIAVKVK